MSKNNSDDFEQSVAAAVGKLEPAEYESLQARFRVLLDSLAETGDVDFGPDYRLGDKALETRVLLMLRNMGLAAEKGRESREDIVVPVPEFAEPSIPLVIEVKSGVRPPGRAALRELDDWVFDLSGESTNRKLGVKNQGRIRSWLSKGAMQAAPFASEPQKGVLVFSIRSEEAYNDPLHPQNQPHHNDIQYAESRGFCVISMPCLLSWEAACKTGQGVLKDFWTQVQDCYGVLPHRNS